MREATALWAVPGVMGEAIVVSGDFIRRFHRLTQMGLGWGAHETPAFVYSYSESFRERAAPQARKDTKGLA